MFEHFLYLLFYIHTIFVRTHYDWMRARSIAHRCTGQHPYLIFGPTFQFIQNNARLVQSGDGRLIVGAANIHEEYLVIDNTAIWTFRWRWQPIYGNCSGTGGRGSNIARRGTWYYRYKLERVQVCVMISWILFNSFYLNVRIFVFFYLFLLRKWLSFLKTKIIL